MSATNRGKRTQKVEADVRELVARVQRHARAGTLPAEDLEAYVSRELTRIFAVPIKTPRSKGDFYETPGWVVDAIIPHLSLAESPIVLDAGAGTGAISARLSVKIPSAEIIGVEKCAEHAEKARARKLYNVEIVYADFLKWEPELEAPDLVVMNPPFSYSLEFVQHALKIAKRGATVAVLLRLDWVAAKSRREFHKKNPSDVYVLPRRPSFTGDGHTDASNYAWFVWGPGRGNKWEILACEFPRKKTPKTAKGPKKSREPKDLTGKPDSGSAIAA